MGAPPNSATWTAQQLFQQAGYQPITITSDYAEIIYFLRNGNLYRRVLLVAPERQSAVVPTIGNTATIVSAGVNVPLTFNPLGLGGNTTVSWQGMNDLSAHPAPTGPDPNALPTHNSVILNTLTDLTNRENRWAYQRFANDFQSNLTGAVGQDNLADDFNGDNVPDYYPSLYGGIFVNPTNQLTFEPPYGPLVPGFRGLMAFPYVFPGAYSCPQILSTGFAPYGWIHSPNPQVYIASTNSSVAFDSNPLLYLNTINHNPIDLGDNLPIPPGLPTILNGIPMNQTWWGFPTWRETLSFGWADPTVQLNLNQAQPTGLTWRSTATLPVTSDANLLPPMRAPSPYLADFSFIRRKPDLFSDGWGALSSFWAGTAVTIDPLWSQSWEDDLIMTGVRSFDIKAYDNSLAAYADLGWGDDPRVTLNNAIPYLQGNLDVVTNGYNLPAYGVVNGAYVDVINQTFAHEGRMPPLLNDNRLDASYPNPTYVNLGKFTPQYTLPNPDFPNGFPNYSSNIGDNQQGIVRLRRVWDSWSTEYTQAPATGVYLNKNNPPADPLNGFPWGPPYSPPIFPSYPPPYPAPLRGIQIQIRVADPTNQRIKTLTVRHDFTDKL